ncbi:MAG: ketopantoate reductase C-terminal domain-containing protein [Bacteroidota bacterium]|nr:ketopantoate reductase C-terminal domain-containing protein [Bacteroidota bacterium]
MFKQTNIQATYSRNISTIILGEIIFLSPTATITSAFDKCIGEILSDKDSLAIMTLLITEITKIAKAKKITVSENITEKTLMKLKSLPFETTTSMHTDFINKEMKTELESLIEFVIKESEKSNIPTPTYLRLYEILEKKVSSSSISNHSI